MARTALYSQGEAKEKAEKLAIEAVEKIEEVIKGKKFFGGESVRNFRECKGDLRL